MIPDKFIGSLDKIPFMIRLSRQWVRQLCHSLIIIINPIVTFQIFFY